MVRAWRFAIADVCRAGSNEAGFQRNIMFLPSQHWDIVSMFVFLGKALYPQMLHLTQVRMSTR